MNTKTLSKEDLLSSKAQTPDIEPVDLPSLGGRVFVRGMSARQRGDWEQTLVRGKKVDARNARASLAAACLVTDETGATRMFSDEEATILGKTRADILQPIFDVAQRLSGVSDKDVDELGKSSGAGDSADSSSN